MARRSTVSSRTLSHWPNVGEPTRMSMTKSMKGPDSVVTYLACDGDRPTEDVIIFRWLRRDSDTPVSEHVLAEDRRKVEFQRPQTARPRRFALLDPRQRECTEIRTSGSRSRVHVYTFD